MPYTGRVRRASHYGANYRRLVDPNFQLYAGREISNFRTLLRHRKFNQADISWRKYQCASGAGHHTINSGTDNDPCTKVVSSTVGRTTFKPGSTVLVGSHVGDRKQVILGYPPPGQKGTSNFPFLSAESGLSSFSIISADPDNIPPGAATESTITGFGFNGTEVFDCVVYNESTMEYDADPYVTVTNQTYVDSEEWTVEFTATSSAPDGYKITVRATRP